VAVVFSMAFAKIRVSLQGKKPFSSLILILGQFIYLKTRLTSGV
jgi:hypothetical protein